MEATHLYMAATRGFKGHINTRILHSGSKAQDKEESRKDGLYDAHLYIPCTIYHIPYTIYYTLHTMY